MEDLVFVILCLISINNLKFKGINLYLTDYMDAKNTSQIKGIFVWIILLSHYRGYFKRNKKYIYIYILNCIGTQKVSMFLFYSGFGIYESIKNKGINYVKTLPKKSFILFIKSQIIIFIYLISNLLLGIKTNIYRYFLSIIFKSSMGNSNWFAFTIILFYLYSYLSFRFIKNQNYFFGIIFISLLCFLHFYLVYNFYYNKIDYTVVNTLPFIIGFFYSLLRKKIETIIMKNDLFYYGTLSFSIIIYYKFYSYEFQTIYIISIINAIF